MKKKKQKSPCRVIPFRFVIIFSPRLSRQTRARQRSLFFITTRLRGFAPSALHGCRPYQVINKRVNTNWMIRSATTLGARRREGGKSNFGDFASGRTIPRENNVYIYRDIMLQSIMYIILSFRPSTRVIRDAIFARAQAFCFSDYFQKKKKMYTFIAHT